MGKQKDYGDDAVSEAEDIFSRAKDLLSIVKDLRDQCQNAEDERDTAEKATKELEVHYEAEQVKLYDRIDQLEKELNWWKSQEDLRGRSLARDLGTLE